MLEVSSSRIDTTLYGMVFLSRFDCNKVSEGVHDRPYASAIAVRMDDRHLVISSLDL